MVDLSIKFVAPFVVKWILWWVFAFVILVVVDLIISRTMFFRLPEIKIRYVFLIALSVGGILFLLCYLKLAKYSEKQVSEVLRCLEACTELKISVTYPNPSGRYITQDVEIEDKVQIKRLLDLLKNRKYTRISSQGEPSTGDRIEVVAYEGGKILCDFRIIICLLEIKLKSDMLRYECSDKELMFSVLQELALPRSGS